MRNRFRIYFMSAVAGSAILLILSGCAPANPPQPTPPPTETQYQANLTAVESGVKVFEAGSLETAVEKDQTVNVHVNDRIEVDSQSRGLLNFPDLLEVELFRNARLLLADAKEESGGSTFVRLNQLQGHIGVTLNDQSLVRVTLETEYATMHTLQDGTQFLVCQAPGNLTCLKVLKGVVEVTAQGEKQLIRAGEATYILKDQPPKPAICAPDDLFIAWLDDYRTSADTPTISQIVAELPQQSCSAASTQTARLAGSAGMVKIDYGTYEVGSEPANEYHSAPFEIPLDNFWIDVYEVTNDQYQQYLDGSGEAPPAVWPGEPDHPVRGVTWEQADAYCTWANKRLPTEAEWEIAGRGPGPDAPLYPWGNDPEDGGNTNTLPLDETYAVGAFPFNVSSFGVYDLAGNVWEWVSEPYDSLPEGLKILRGGRFGFLRDLAYRQAAQSNDERFTPYTGFRCAASQVEE